MHFTRCLLILVFLAMLVLLHFHSEIHCNQSLSVQNEVFYNCVYLCMTMCGQVGIGGSHGGKDKNKTITTETK